jgi:DNA-binding beta-propeller fold protein YncE
MKKLLFFDFYFLLIVLIFQSAHLFAQTSGYKIVDSIKIGGETDWDYLSICEPLNKLFVTQDTQVDVINLENNSIVGKIGNLNDAHGIAFVPELDKGYISDGKHNAVVIFNLKTIKIIESLKTTGNDPDAIVYDSFTKRIFTFNGHSTNATAIDTKSDKVVGTVQLSGSPEFGVSDFNGQMFVNIEKKNKIDVINPKTLKLIKT